MNEIDLKSIIEQHPDCVTNGTKLKAILLDLYPNVSRGVINSIITILNSGIADEIQQSKAVGDIEINRWLNILENDYCMSGTVVKDCLQLWINTFTQEEIIPLLSENPFVSEEEIISAIENYDSLDELCECEIDKYIVCCNYILKNINEYKGFAYYELAKQLHRYDLFIRNPDLDYTDQGPLYCKDFSDYSECLLTSSEKPRWVDIADDIKAFYVLAKRKTNNINVLIECLLRESLKEKYLPAFEALIETYLNEHPYSAYNEFHYSEYYSEDDLKYPWFDITCMNNDFDSLNDTTEPDLKNWGNIDAETNISFAKTALNLLQNRKAYIQEDISIDELAHHYREIMNIVNSWEKFSDNAKQFGVDFYKTELPIIKQFADGGNCGMIELMLTYYTHYAPSDYFGNLIKYGKNGDYCAQCLLAEHYTNQFNAKHKENDFEEASKWYELAIDNKARSIVTTAIENYKKMLEQRDAKKYAQKISELQEKINACHSEWDYLMRHV